ncbi:MAG: S9 family peptidase [Rhodanobacter sp.]
MNRIRRTSVFLAAVLALGTCAAAESTGTPADSLTDAATKARITQIMQLLDKVDRFSGVAVSPDGKHVAWTLNAGDGDRVQLADADGTHVRDLQLADALKGCSESHATWSPDGKSIALLSNCGSGKNRAQQDIYLVDANAAKPLAKRLTHLDGYAHDLTWAPGGHYLGILYVAGDTHLIGATDATKAQVGMIGVTGVENQGVAAVDASNGSVRTITPSSLFAYEYSWSPDASQIAYVAAPPPGTNNWWVAQVYTQATQGQAEPRSIVDPNTVTGSLHGLQVAVPRWSPDAKNIAFIGGLMSDQGATGGDIYVVPANGDAPPVDVTPGIHITPSWVTWTGNQRLLVSSIAGGSSRVSLFSLHGTAAATDSTLLSVPAAISDGTADSALALSANAAHYAFVHSDFTEAPEIYAGSFRISAGQPVAIASSAHAITSANAALKPLWGKAVSVTWTNQGYDVQGWLLFPADYDPHKTYPMIVSVHGGPSSAVVPSWGGGEMAAMGYFVLMPNPRGSFGQGAKFTEAVRRDMGYGDLRDILAGVDAVEKSYPVDDKRLGLQGWSYGGFMSMFAPTQTQRFHAAVAGAGLSNWQSYYGENSIDQWMIPFFGASVYDDPAAYAKSSAINFIKQARTPTLIVVGERDAECPAPQSFEYWHGLRALGTPTELVVYAGEGHGFHKKEDRRDILERSLAWFGKYLGP